jgi:hypothetical protein
MKHPKTAKKILHGQMIAVTSLTAARLQGDLLKKYSSFSPSILSSLAQFNPSSLAHRAEDLMRLNSTQKRMRSSTLRIKDDGCDEKGDGRDERDDDCGREWKSVEIFFGKKIAAECKKEFAQKIFSTAQLKKINSNLAKNWKKIRSDLQKIHLDEAYLKKIFSHFKIKVSPKSLGLSHQQYQACIVNAKFIRNRFTCLDIVNN